MFFSVNVIFCSLPPFLGIYFLLSSYHSYLHLFILGGSWFSSWGLALSVPRFRCFAPVTDPGSLFQVHSGSLLQRRGLDLLSWEGVPEVLLFNPRWSFLSSFLGRVLEVLPFNPRRRFISSFLRRIPEVCSSLLSGGLDFLSWEGVLKSCFSILGGYFYFHSWEGSLKFALVLDLLSWEGA